MSVQRTVSHSLVWAGVFGFWLYLSSHYHPTLLVGALATAVLVAASAFAVYANRWLLSRRGFTVRRSRWRYPVLILAILIVADLVAVLTIQVVYDTLWGPDPLRFSFGSNLASDGAFIAAHLIVGTALLRFGKRVPS